MTKRAKRAGATTTHEGPNEGERDKQGRFLRHPAGARPLWRKGQSGNPSGKPGSVVARLKWAMEGRLELPERLRQLVEACTSATPKGGAPDIPQGLVNVILALAFDETQDAGDRVAIVKWITDRVDGAVALKVEGLSEAHMRAWALRVAENLKRELPPEHHPAIARAILAACEVEGEREVEAEPAGELPPASGT